MDQETVSAPDFFVELGRIETSDMSAEDKTLSLLDVTGQALVATREALRIGIIYTVAQHSTHAVAFAVGMGAPIPDGVEVPPWVHDALKVLGQRATEALQ
jgi:hypothetical protein